MKVMKKTLFSLILMAFSLHIDAQTERRGNATERSQQRTNNQTTTSQLRSSGLGNNFSPSQNDFNRTRTTSQIQQNSINNWNQLDKEERHQMIKNMNPRERSQFMQTVKEDIILDELNIPKESQEEFKEIFKQYTLSQKQIKDKFKGTIDIEKLSSDEAKQKLDESFEVGKQLLNNRQLYADKFLKILTPQQVLKFFQTEGKVRDKIIDKKYGGKEK